jgi:DDE superfamily endonuclease
MHSRQQQLSCGLLLLCAGLHHIRRRRNEPRVRRASRLRVRPCLSTVVRDLSEGEFRRVFRMERCTFSSLLTILLPDLLLDVSMGMRSSGGRIEPEIRLALTLRMLAGASYLDTVMLFAISRSSCYAVFHDTISSILSRLKMPGLPFDDIQNLDALSQEFSESRLHANPLVGCVGAVDGIAVKIAKPRDCFVPRNYYCLKGFYSAPFQAIVDGRYRFLSLSSVVCGSTHDSLAFRASFIGEKLYSQGLPSGYWVAGDAAYVCSESLLVPFCAVQLRHEEEGEWRDSFNYFQSSFRVHVEQAFGILVNRFGILWRALDFDLPKAGRIVSACALLHNYIIDNSNSTELDAVQNDVERLYATQAFGRWWRESQRFKAASCSGSGTRSDLERSNLWNMLVARLKELGQTRPR